MKAMHSISLLALSLAAGLAAPAWAEPRDAASGQATGVVALDPRDPDGVAKPAQTGGQNLRDIEIELRSTGDTPPAAPSSGQASGVVAPNSGDQGIIAILIGAKSPDGPPNPGTPQTQSGTQSPHDPASGQAAARTGTCDGFIGCSSDGQSMVRGMAAGGSAPQGNSSTWGDATGHTDGVAVRNDGEIFAGAATANGFVIPLDHSHGTLTSQPGSTGQNERTANPNSGATSDANATVALTKDAGQVRQPMVGRERPKPTGPGMRKPRKKPN